MVVSALIFVLGIDLIKEVRGVDVCAAFYHYLFTRL